MTFTTSKGTFRLSFFYADVEVKGRQGFYRVTMAKLYELVGKDSDGRNLWEAIEWASAACAPGDRFEKETGRQLALRRLAQNICEVKLDYVPKVEGSPWRVNRIYHFSPHGNRELRGATLAAYYGRAKRGK